VDFKARQKTPVIKKINFNLLAEYCQFINSILLDTHQTISSKTQ